MTLSEYEALYPELKEAQAAYEEGYKKGVEDCILRLSIAKDLLAYPGNDQTYIRSMSAALDLINQMFSNLITKETEQSR